MSENKFLMKKSTSLVCLVIISLISLILKLIFIDFSIPVTSDNLDYLLMSISYLNGDFSQSVHRAGGWPLFVSMFYQIAQPEEFQDFSNLIRILAMSISKITQMSIKTEKHPRAQLRYVSGLACDEIHGVYNH